MIIRAEKRDDYNKIEKVIKSAFGAENKPDDFNEWVLVGKIRENASYIKELSLVAEIEEEIVGHAMFSLATIENEQVIQNTLALAPVSVDKKFQRKGIGSKLISEGIKIAEDLGYESIIVMGDPEYYTRFGFEKASKWTIGIDEAYDSDYLFVLELRPGALNSVYGIIKYSKPFYDEGELI